MVMLSTDSAYVFNKMNNFQEFRESFVGQLIYKDLQNVVGNAFVWNVFLKWSTLSHSEAVAAVCGETYPFVVVRPEFDGTASGCFDPKEPHIIRIGREEAQHAKGVADEFQRREALKGLEATILHELVHWGRHKNGAPQTKYKKDGKGGFVEIKPGETVAAIDKFDVGRRFEVEAYPYYIPVSMPYTTKLSHFVY